MSHFFQSSAFVWFAIGFSLVVVVFAILRRNTVWEPRGITPRKDVKKLEERVKDLKDRLIKLLPKSSWGRGFLLLPVLLYVGYRLVSSIPFGALTLTPSFEGISWFAKSYWLLILVAAGLVYLFAGRVGKLEHELKTATGAILFLLFVVSPIVTNINKGPLAAATTKSAVPLTSLPRSEWPRLVIPPLANSAHIRQEPYMRPHFIGDTKVLRLHTVYVGGRDCVQDCQAGPIDYYYIENQSAETVPVPYAYEHM